MSDNLMEDINDFHFPPAELTIGSKLKCHSSSHFKRNITMICLSTFNTLHMVERKEQSIKLLSSFCFLTFIYIPVITPLSTHYSSNCKNKQICIPSMSLKHSYFERIQCSQRSPVVSWPVREEKSNKILL